MAEGKGGGKGMGAREQGLHQDDADEDDENVKQLQQCSSLYLLLQVFFTNSTSKKKKKTEFLFSKTLNPKPWIGIHHYHWIEEPDFDVLQDCLVKTDRNWRSCQKGMLFPSFFVAFVVLFCE